MSSLSVRGFSKGRAIRGLIEKPLAVPCGDLGERQAKSVRLVKSDARKLRILFVPSHYQRQLHTQRHAVPCPLVTSKDIDTGSRG